MTWIWDRASLYIRCVSNTKIEIFLCRFITINMLMFSGHEVHQTDRELVYCIVSTAVIVDTIYKKYLYTHLFLCFVERLYIFFDKFFKINIGTRTVPTHRENPKEYISHFFFFKLIFIFENMSYYENIKICECSPVCVCVYVRQSVNLIIISCSG